MSCAKMAEAIEMPFGILTWSGSKEACVRWWCPLALPGEYDWTVRVQRQQCSLFVKLLWPLVYFWLVTVKVKSRCECHVGRLVHRCHFLLSYVWRRRNLIANTALRLVSIPSATEPVPRLYVPCVFAFAVVIMPWYYVTAALLHCSHVYISVCQGHLSSLSSWSKAPCGLRGRM